MRSIFLDFAVNVKIMTTTAVCRPSQIEPALALPALPRPSSALDSAKSDQFSVLAPCLCCRIKLHRAWTRERKKDDLTVDAEA